MSVESNSLLLWFCIIALDDWFKNLAQLSQPIRSKTKTSDLLIHTRFPALCVGYMCLLRVLIGSLVRSVSFVISQSDYLLVFGFSTLN